MENQNQYNELEELVQEERRLRAQLSANIKAQKCIERLSFVRKYGFDIGDKVQWKYAQKIYRGVISNVDTTGLYPYYFANVLKANGQPSKVERRIWYPDTLKKLD